MHLLLREVAEHAIIVTVTDAEHNENIRSMCEICSKLTIKTPGGLP